MHGYDPSIAIYCGPYMNWPDFQREFTLLLLPLLARKLKRSIPALLAHPPVLAHTIYQALTFDSSLKEESFDLAGTSKGRQSSQKVSGTKDHWEGISEIILGRKEWFEAWMEEERKCESIVALNDYAILIPYAVAMNQYMDIISTSDAWLIANDDGNDDEATAIDRELKPTNSARRVKALVEQVTGEVAHQFILEDPTNLEGCRSLFTVTAVHTTYTLLDHCTTSSVGILPCAYIGLARCIRNIVIYSHARSSRSPWQYKQ